MDLKSLRARIERRRVARGRGSWSCRLAMAVVDAERLTFDRATADVGALKWSKCSWTFARHGDTILPGPPQEALRSHVLHKAPFLWTCLHEHVMSRTECLTRRGGACKAGRRFDGIDTGQLLLLFVRSSF